MKKALSIIEITLLTFITIFNWHRFDGKNSLPYFLESGLIEITLFILLTVSLLGRGYILWQTNFRQQRLEQKIQIFTLGLYLLAIGLDLYNFVRWQIYANLYGEFLLILIAPLIVGFINQKIKKKRFANNDYT